MNQTKSRGGIVKGFKAYRHPHILYKDGYKFEHEGNGTYKLHRKALKQLADKHRLSKPADSEILEHELQPNWVMGKDMYGTCITNSGSYDGAGEGGECTLVYEARGQMSTVDNVKYSSTGYDAVDGDANIYAATGQFKDAYSDNLLYSHERAIQPKISPSWFQHNSQYDCELNCPRGNYWDKTPVAANDQYNPGTFTGMGKNLESTWSTQGVSNWDNGEWWTAQGGSLACLNNVDIGCEDMGAVYGETADCPYYAGVLQNNYCERGENEWVGEEVAKFPFVWQRPVAEDDGTAYGTKAIFSKYNTKPINEFSRIWMVQNTPEKTTYDEAFGTEMVPDAYMHQITDVRPANTAVSYTHLRAHET